MSEKDSSELEDYKATSTPANEKKACQVSNKALIKAWIKVWLFLLFFYTAARLTQPYSESGIHTVEYG
jgi:hypothetical protein